MAELKDLFGGELGPLTAVQLENARLWLTERNKSEDGNINKRLEEVALMLLETVYSYKMDVDELEDQLADKEAELKIAEDRVTVLSYAQAMLVGKVEVALVDHDMGTQLLDMWRTQVDEYRRKQNLLG